MDYCEIILDSVHKIVTTEMAKELLAIPNSMIVGQILEDKGIINNIHSFTVQEAGGQQLTAIMVGGAFELQIDDYVYLSGNNILAKKLDNSQVPIEINESLKDFVSFWEWSYGTEKAIITPKSYNRLLLEAVVKSKDKKPVNDNWNYTIKIRITNENGYIYELNFSEDDLFGHRENLYKSLQKQMYNLNLGNITNLSIVLEGTSAYETIKVSLGNNAENLTDEMGLKLEAGIGLKEYKTGFNGQVSSPSSVQLNWIWLYTDETGKLNKITNQNKDDSNFECIYYRYNDKYNTGDEYGGLYWEKIDITNDLLQINHFLPAEEQTKIKLVIIRGQHVATSNELIFNNIKITTEGKISNLNLQFNRDTRNGRYPLYSPTGTMLAKYVAQGEKTKERVLQLNYVPAIENLELDSMIESVVWTIDIDKIVLSNSCIEADGVIVKETKKDNFGNLIISIDTTQRKDSDGNPNWNSIEFYLKDNIILSDGNSDIITCKVRLKNDPIEYVVTKELQFTTDTLGNSGYSIYSELIDARSGKVAYYAIAGNDYKLRVWVYDEQGELVTNYKIRSSSWWGYGSNDSLNYIYDLKSSDLVQTEIQLVQNRYGSIEERCSHIIKLNINITTKLNDTINIPYYYPLIVVHGQSGVTCAPKKIDYICQGPPEFVYDSFGKIMDASGKTAKIIDSNGEPVSISQLSLYTKQHSPEGSVVTYEVELTGGTGVSGAWHPTVRAIDSNSYIITPSNSYDQTLNNDAMKTKYLCNLVFRLSNYDRICWPILIRQDTGFSSYIDKWDGKLLIDENNNAISSASLVAGKKNIDNTFTGVVIGDIQNIEDSGGSTIESGIIGFKKGVQSFGFNTDGTAFIGPSGSGRIYFDGNNATIQSGTYIKPGTREKFATQGMSIDLDAENSEGKKSGSITASGFYLDADGNAGIKGHVEATSGFIGESEEKGWNIDSTSITHGSLGSQGSLCLYADDQTYNATIGPGKSKNNWRFGIGTNFGIDADGNVFAQDGVLHGGEIKIGTQTDGQYPFSVDDTGHLYTSDIQVKDTINIGNAQIAARYSTETGEVDIEGAYATLSEGEVKAVAVQVSAWIDFDVYATGKITVNIPFNRSYPVDTTWKVTVSYDIGIYRPTEYAPDPSMYITKQKLQNTIKLNAGQSGMQEYTFDFTTSHVRNNVIGFDIYNNIVKYQCLLNATTVQVSPSSSGSTYYTFKINTSLEPTSDEKFNIGSPTSVWERIYATRFETREWQTEDGNHLRVCLAPNGLYFIQRRSSAGYDPNGESNAGLKCNWAGTTITMNGKWEIAQGNFIETSSRLYKNSIEELSEKYSVLFDALRPIRYKYNDDQLGRYHTGYIAEDLKQAIDTANLSTLDFAAYNISDEATGEGGICYTELIALNTWQIQKLKSRITQLEKILREKGEIIK